MFKSRQETVLWLFLPLSSIDFSPCSLLHMSPSSTDQFYAWARFRIIEQLQQSDSSFSAYVKDQYIMSSGFPVHA
jgi:hypothetical protein